MFGTGDILVLYTHFLMRMFSHTLSGRTEDVAFLLFIGWIRVETH